ncbi:VTE1 [Scenedesmus sp. PABB004]|nr:VTE1 [Scenedesmus sp. PABB004]
MGPDDGYVCQFSRDTSPFWASRHTLELGAVLRRRPTAAQRALPRGPLPEAEFAALSEQGFQATSTWQQGSIVASEAGTPGPPLSTVSECSWALSITPRVGWGDAPAAQRGAGAGGSQRATAGWLSMLSVFEPHWQVLMAEGSASGWLQWGAQRYEFSGAPAYAEKNWGGGFPSRWIWVQCNTFDVPGLSVTAVGARRQLLLGLQGAEEDVGMLGIHLPDGEFVELVPWAGEVEWSADPWGRWWLRGRGRRHEAVLEASCAPGAGAVLRAPTADAGLSPHCKDTFFGTARLRVWALDGGGRLPAGAAPLVDATSTTAALEVGGGPCKERACEAARPEQRPSLLASRRRAPPRRLHAAVVMRALVRGVASSFERALSSGGAAISLALALEQHAAYVDLLKRLLGAGSVIQLPADDAHPDCCFVEDTAVVAGRTAVVARIGTPSRAGEEAPVAAALAGLGYELAHLPPGAALDGGDVLQLPGSGDVVVGLSGRTNAAGAAALASALPGRAVHAVRVAQGLHLKSACSPLDARTLLVADSPAGRGVAAELAALPAMAGWAHVAVPDAVAANVLLLGDAGVVMQGGCAASEALLARLCAERSLALHTLPRMTEMVKADAALTCGHCVCEVCFSASRLKVCVECRQPADRPHLAYALMRIVACISPSSPTSFPIGCAADDAGDDAPGTPPRPSAPVMEIEAWESGSSGSGGGAGASSSGGGAQLSQSAGSRGGVVGAPSAPGSRGTSGGGSSAGAASPALSSHPLAPTDGLGWPAAPLGGAAAPGTRAALAGLSGGGARASHELLASFPVDDADLDCLPLSPAGSDDGEARRPGGEAGSDARAALAASRALSAAQGALLGLAQQLVISPHRLFEQQPGEGQGWPASGPSLLLAVAAAGCRAWAGFSVALSSTLQVVRGEQLRLVGLLDRCLAAHGLPGAGNIAACVLGTWAVGVLLHHRQLALHVLPLGAGGLALAAAAAMPEAGLWPARAACGLLAADVLLLGLLAAVWRGGGGLHAALAAATPAVLAVAGLLCAAQVVVEVLGRGWADAQQLRFASLVCRAWAVTAAAAAGGRPLTAIAWAQKVALLLEAPLLVRHAALLWPGGAGAARRRAGAGGAHGRGAAEQAGSGVSAWLMCTHALLQLLLLMYVPPAPLAAAAWLPAPVRGGLAWAARVLLCGCLAQAALNAGAGGGSGLPTGGVALPPARRGDGDRPGSACGERAAADCCGGGPAAADGCGATSSSLQLAAPGSWDLALPSRAATSSSGGGAAAALAAGGRLAAAAGGAAALARQHAVHLLLLAAAAAGDEFIAAVPSAGAVRAAWHALVTRALVAMFACELVAAALSEAALVRRLRGAGALAWGSCDVPRRCE